MPLPVILALVLLFILWIAISKNDHLAGFWKHSSKPRDSKQPTTEDIQRKYESQKRIRAEKSKQRQDAYNRDLVERQQESQTYPDTPKYRKLLSMIGGDKVAAHRLISAYGIDRAISDLERDRQI